MKEPAGQLVKDGPTRRRRRLRSAVNAWRRIPAHSGSHRRDLRTKSDLYTSCP